MRHILAIVTLLLLVSVLYGQSGVPAESSSLERFKSRVEAVHLSSTAIVGLISMIPIFELRGAIPIGILGYKLPWWQVFVVACIGNIVPIILILLLLDPARRLLANIPVCDRFFEWLFKRTRKHSGAIEKYEALGLIVFVAIPLPGTGAWSGAVAAYIFGLPYWKSLLCCFLGVLGAGIVVTILTLLGWVGAAIALVAFIALIILPMLRIRRESRVDS